MAGRRLSSNDVSVVIALAIVVLVLLLVVAVEQRAARGDATDAAEGVGAGAATELAAASQFVGASSLASNAAASGDSCGGLAVQHAPSVSSGAFAGVWDSATTTIFYTAARDGLSRKMYLYPGGSSANYWYGDILLDASFQGAWDGAVEISANWKAAGAITPVGKV